MQLVLVAGASYAIFSHPWLLLLLGTGFVICCVLVGKTFWRACLSLLALTATACAIAGGVMMWMAGSLKDPIGAPLCSSGIIALALFGAVSNALVERERDRQEFERRTKCGSGGPRDKEGQQ